MKAPSAFARVADSLLALTMLSASKLRHRRLQLRRRHLFDQIMQTVHTKPDHASIKFGQALLLSSSEVTDVVLQEEVGVLYFTVDSTYHGMRGQHSWSLFLTGDIFRVGLLLSGGLEVAPQVDWHNEMTDLWPGAAPEQRDRAGVTMYEWTFLVPDIYTNAVTQERFVLGMRHSHGRVLRIIHDFFKVQSEVKTGSEQAVLAARGKPGPATQPTFAEEQRPQAAHSR